MVKLERTLLFTLIPIVFSNIKENSLYKENKVVGNNSNDLYSCTANL